MITRIKGKCARKGCRRKATEIACGKPLGDNPNPQCYCSRDAFLVSSEGNPEYRECCPNCGCHYGVN